MDALDLLSGKIWPCEESYVRTVRDVLETHHNSDPARIEATLLAYRKRRDESQREAQQERADDLLTAFPGTAIDGTREATLHGSAGKQVAILPLRGGIYPRANMVTEFSGGTSLSLWARDFQRVMATPAAKSVLLMVDSPGGVIDGVAEAHEMVKAARGVKDVVAYVDGQGSSAAYWILSGAQAVFASPTARVGSLGVVTTVVDDRKAMEQRGVKHIEIVSKNAPLKRGTPDDEAMMAALRKNLDDVERVFLSQVAKARGVTLKKVMEDYGRGGQLVGRSAMNAGLVDGVLRLDDLLALMIEKK